MICESVMNAQPVTALGTSTISETLDMLIEHRLISIAVVNAHGKFLGQFGLHHLLGLIMPKAATMDRSLDDLGFVTESIDQLKTRLAHCLPRKVSEYLEEESIAVHPETSLAKGLMLLYKHGGDLPVVDAHGKLVGIVSPWDIVSKIKNNK